MRQHGNRSSKKVCRLFPFTKNLLIFANIVANKICQETEQAAVRNKKKKTDTIYKKYFYDTHANRTGSGSYSPMDRCPLRIAGPGGHFRNRIGHPCFRVPTGTKYPTDGCYLHHHRRRDLCRHSASIGGHGLG